ncbi:hypothetical protein Hamer_G006617 [Homarus americanus]|uniref:Uncharacterized protein n=1 Tax=Homarus americanus TaxID=6706 RepID=A0A8J5JFZ9_HOMAM|nr:hypothetical protein Hamer_G006617 [Homarus americanus]
MGVVEERGDMRRSVWSDVEGRQDIYKDYIRRETSQERSILQDRNRLKIRTDIKKLHENLIQNKEIFEGTQTFTLGNSFEGFKKNTK